MNARNPVGSWIRICRVDDIPRLGARVIERPTELGNIAVFRNGDDRVFALLDRCPHKGGPLSQGIVYDERVACPLHGWSIELANGCASAPDEGCTQRFAINVDDGDVYLEPTALVAAATPPLPSTTSTPSDSGVTDRSNTDPARVPADGI